MISDVSSSRTSSVSFDEPRPTPGSSGGGVFSNVQDAISRAFTAVRESTAVERLADIAGIPGPAPNGRTLVSSENSVTAGPLGVKDAYDLRLYKEPGGAYTLEVRMGLDFNFKDGVDASGKALPWTAESKRSFIADYQRTVEGVWDGKRVGTAPNGKPIRLDIRLDARETMVGENFNVDVKRIGAGEFSTSYVEPAANRVTLDSQDVVLTPKGEGQTQYGSAHEFGHMLGLKDEYNGGAHVKDYPSIMNRGSTVESRHLKDFSDWVGRAIR